MVTRGHRDRKSWGKEAMGTGGHEDRGVMGTWLMPGADQRGAD